MTLWPQRGELVAPDRGEVHVWTLSTTQVTARFEALLSDAEERRAARFARATDRNAFVVGRGALRTLVAGYTGKRAETIEFDAGPNGKPRVPPDGRLDLRFNLSHSGEIVVLGFAVGDEVGVDVEQLRGFAARDELVCRFFTPRERDSYFAEAEDDRDACFFRLWTRKEAIVKAMGTGLAMLEHVEVPTKTVPFSRSGTSATVGRVGRWRLVDLDVGEGYHATLAAVASSPPR